MDIVYFVKTKFKVSDMPASSTVHITNIKILLLLISLFIYNLHEKNIMNGFKICCFEITLPNAQLNSFKTEVQKHHFSLSDPMRV